MLQVIQSFKTGKLEVADVPAPTRPHGFVLGETLVSAVSPGTERTMIDLAKKSLVGKAIERPDLVRQVLDKVAREGVVASALAVKNKLDSAAPLGYSSVARVLETDASIPHARVGERVACGGAGYAAHAEIVRVPKNLCVAVPDEVADEDAAYATIAAIALQGVRVAGAQLGETVVVVGLGLIGLMTVQIARAAGCDVIGVDIAPWRIALARELGAKLALHREEGDIARLVQDATNGVGADAVIVAASTPTNDPLVLAGEVARPRARVALVGLTGTEIPRKSYYEKELSVALSTSYGPGRYDPTYEERGVDYPIGYVRWTEQRNIAEALRLMAIGALKIAPLRTHSSRIADAERAYELVTNPGAERVLGMSLVYPARPNKLAPALSEASVARARGRVRIGVIGAGNFVRGSILPALRDTKDVDVVAIAARGGLQAKDLARAFGVPRALSDADAVLADPEIDAVVIATRHDSHARLAMRALEAKKHVFVEKPPATSLADLADLRAAWERCGAELFVGYNRDVAPLTRFVVAELGPAIGPRQILVRVNAGAVPASSWVHDASEGGGRWIGEGCHFVALAARLAESRVTRASGFASRGDPHMRPDENLVAALSFANGSVATILYSASGSRSFSKERVEVFGGGAVATIDDFKSASVVKGSKTKNERVWKADKGHAALLADFVDACRGRKVGRDDTLRWLDATAATLAVARSLETGATETPR